MLYILNAPMQKMMFQNFALLDNVCLENSRNRGVLIVSGHKLESRDIVDGHRQKTLQLLWTLIFVFQVITALLFSVMLLSAILLLLLL